MSKQNSIWTLTHSHPPQWRDEYSTDTMLARAKASEQRGMQRGILGKWAEPEWIIGVLGKSLTTAVFCFCWERGEDRSLPTAAQVWRGQTSWVKTGLLARPLAGLQTTPWGSMGSVCVCERDKHTLCSHISNRHPNHLNTAETLMSHRCACW